MDVRPEDVARLPVENLRVPRADFVALWLAAERHQEEQTARQDVDWYGAGVVESCRWLARVIVRTTEGSWWPARSPVTRRADQAYPELIEAECIAADRLAARQPAWLAARPGWSDAILATLNWAWRDSGRPPFSVDISAAG